MMSQQALGLAANQVGIPYRVMAMNVQAGPWAGQQIVMYNPGIHTVSDDLWRHSEGCLSFPGVLLDIARPQSVDVYFQDEDQNSYLHTFTDMDAKCFLHEIDHLNGRVFKEYVSDLKYQRALKKSRR